MAVFRVKEGARLYWQGGIYGPGELIEVADGGPRPSAALVDEVVPAGPAPDGEDEVASVRRRERRRTRMVTRAPERG